VFDGLHSPSVVYNPNAESDECYVMLGYTRSGERGCTAAHSPDGLHWTLYAKNPVFPSNDTCSLLYDPKAGEYFAFHKRSEVYRGHERRIVYLATSRDMQQWSDATLVMAPDAIDDAQVHREGGEYGEFYNMTAFPYAGQFLGFVTHFRYMRRLAESAPMQSKDDGPIDVQLVHSRDGRTWARCEDRSPVIPNGPHAYDAGCILGVANSVVEMGDQIWTYYTAITTTHGGAVPEKQITIARAAWRRDGFVSLDAAADTGTVQTVPLECAGDTLRVNAKAGHMTAAVLDASGQYIPGYGHEDCMEITGDSVHHTVAWKEHEDLPEPRPLRVEFRMRHTELYSFTIATR
jgi:hypothetical protein